MITVQKKNIEVSKNTSRVYFPNLDGLRFAAFFAVFLAHSFYSENSDILSLNIHQNVKALSGNGIFGVNFFFVLSGFLITYLLLHEEHKFGRVHKRAFYIRRILRIWPLYYLVVFIGFVLFPIGKILLGEPTVETANIWYYLFFINNYDDPPSTAVLGVLWSIAVEEQFYLFWPLLIGYLFKKNKIYVFYTIVVLSFIWRSSGLGGYADTLSCISDMAIGGLGAYYAFSSKKFVEFFRALPKEIILLVYCMGITMILTQGLWAKQFYIISANKRLLYSLFFLFVILEQNYANRSFYKMCHWRLISKWGTYTYGLYMLHFPVIYVTGKLVRSLVGDSSLFHVLITETLVAFLVSLAIAYCSFHFFEKHFLKVKEKFAFVLK